MSTDGTNPTHTEEEAKPQEAEPDEEEAWPGAVGRDCVVCQNAAVNRVLLPCRHACVCDECVWRFQHCPMCRAYVFESFTLSPPTTTHPLWWGAGLITHAHTALIFLIDTVVILFILHSKHFRIRLEELKVQSLCLNLILLRFTLLHRFHHTTVSGKCSAFPNAPHWPQCKTHL